MSNALAIINPTNALSVRTYKNSETRTYGGALKFIPFCKAEGLDNTNSTHAERVLKHSQHCNDVNNKGQALLSKMQSDGLVFDKVSVNTDSNGVRRMSLSYVKSVVPKERIRKEAKLARRVEMATKEAQAEIDAILAKYDQKTQVIEA